jgi:hypothetical protein
MPSKFGKASCTGLFFYYVGGGWENRKHKGIAYCKFKNFKNARSYRFKAGASQSILLPLFPSKDQKEL